MSLLRLPKIRELGNACERVWDRFVGGDRRAIGARKPRRLMIDPLEARQLLSVSPVNADDVLVNQSGSSDQSMLSGKSVACNDSGDFVVTWTRVDAVLDANGEAVIDPATNQPMTDANVYARYYTDAVQRITLPANLAGGGSFAIQYNGNEVQQISFSAGSAPFLGEELMTGTFTLTFGGQSRVIGFSETRYGTAVYSPYGTAPWSNPNNDPALNMQAALRDMGGVLADVTVQATDAHTYLINFGEASGGVPQNLLVVANTSLTGFLPAVDVTMVREPGMTVNIAVSNNPALTAAENMAQTAQNIEYAFQLPSVVALPITGYPTGSTTAEIGPVDFNNNPPYNTGPYYSPDTLRTALPAVTVTARSLTEFDITFTGDSGFKQQPLVSVINPATAKPLVGATARIIKQSSDEFRVNAMEVQDPSALRPQYYDQINPQVAMDADGDFVITWESEVPNSVNNGSVSDIFARRFSPAGYVTQIQDVQFTANTGVTALSGTFTLTTAFGVTVPIMFNSTELAKVAQDVRAALIGQGYDADSTTVTFQAGTSPYVMRVTWAGEDVTESIQAIVVTPVASPVALPATVNVTKQASGTVSFLADMDHDGLDAEAPIQGVRALGSEFQVNSFTTNAQTMAAIGMDSDGNFTIAWESEAQDISFLNNIEAQRYDRDGNRVGNEFRVNTFDRATANYDARVAMGHDGVLVVGWGYLGGIQAKIYNDNGTVLVPEFRVADNCFDASFDFNAIDDLVVTWTAPDTQNTGGATYFGVYATEYQLFDQTSHALSFQTIRPAFKVNSGLWPLDQTGAQVAIDADGDMTISYTGFGPDVSETDIDQVLKQTLIASTVSYYGQELVGTTTVPGWFRLKLNGITTGDIEYTTPDQTAAAIQAQLELIEPGTTVVYKTGMFKVEFTTSKTATQRPLITFVAPADATHTRLVGTYQARFADPLVSHSLSYYGQELSGTVTSPGWFRLTLNGTTTVDIEFTSDLNQTAANIQAQLELIVPGTTVVYADGAFQVAFPTSQTVEQRPLITFETPSDPTHTPLTGTLQAAFTYASGADRLDVEQSDGLLRGEANGAMYSQYEADPRLVSFATLASDSVANNTRDGQNTRYLLQLDRTAVSGNFTVTVLNGSNGVEATVVITPVYYPNGGPINPGETAKAIHDALSSLPNVGVNWPHPWFEGSIAVRLLGSAELTASLGTPWDPTVSPANLDITHLIYEVTFMGEVHDTPMYLTVTDSTLKLGAAATGTQQQLTFSGGSGWYNIGVSGSTTTTYFNSADPAGMAASIAGTLQGIAPAGVTVTCDLVSTSGPPHVYIVTFSTAQSQITTSPANPALGQLLTPLPSVKMLGAPAPWPLAVCETRGDYGTSQYDASIAITPSGDFVMVWNENAEYTTGGTSNTNLYYRTFAESTDTAGPLVTDFLLPTDTDTSLRLKEDATVRQAVEYIIVTFDEDMMTTGDNSVTNPNNWALLKDGALVSGGVVTIYYGMNEGATRFGAAASNKWEAVIVLNGNGNSQTGSTYLADGHYQIAALNSLRDKAGNALGRTGFVPNGVSFTRDFDVVLPTGSETLVNTETTLDQGVSPTDEIQRIAFTPTGTSAANPTFTLSIGDFVSGPILFNSSASGLTTMAAAVQTQLRLAGYSGAVVEVAQATVPYVLNVRFGGDDTAKDQPTISISPSVSPLTELKVTVSVTEYQKGVEAPVPQATASNANGDYVTVWTSDTTGSDGVYAKLYAAEWNTTTPRTSVVTPSQDILITSTSGTRFYGGRTVSYTNAGSASVACDAMGNFVVTWSEKDAGDWNVWACKFDVNGNVLIDPFRVNSTTADIQRYSAVAMDSSGAFVITWQSYSTATGWDIFAQRYDATAKQIGSHVGAETTGQTVGGRNEAQLLTFIGRQTSTFTLVWDDGSPGATVTGTISYQSNNATATAKLIEAELNTLIRARMSITDTTVQVVKTTVVSNTQILIEYVGAAGDLNQPQLAVNVISSVGDSDAAIVVETSVEGSTGEFRVNDTTVNNQMFPSIAMNSSEDCVISWTSYGQDGDGLYQSNVYAKQFSAKSNSGSAFDITLQLSGGLTPSQQAIFALAAARWESIIIGDVADVLTASGLVDDIVIDASGVYIDGTDGILGQAGPTGIRNGSFLPYAGIMQFDTADLASLESSGQLLDVITHEMGHVLGFGTIWTDLNLLTGNGGSDPQFTGAGAVAEYNKAFGLTVTSVPVEATGGSGTAYAHWRETVFGTELMTGWLDAGTNPLSRMSAASMGDLGYQVNVNAASVYLQSNTSSSSVIAGWMGTLNMPRTYADALASADAAIEMRVNQTVADDQKWSSVGIDADGDFVITWTSFGQDGSGDGPGSGVNGVNGVYARRYSSSGQAASSEFLVTTFTANDQQYSKVAMNAAGDFTIVWESYQDRPTVANGPNAGTDSADSYGIYGQRYVRNSLVGMPLYPNGPVITGAHGELQDEFRVNTTTEQNQRYPSIAMDDAGDFVVTWTGFGNQSGQEDTQGVFMQRFDQSSDAAGPTVVSTTDTTSAPDQLVGEGDVVHDKVSTFEVFFSELVAFDDPSTPAIEANAVDNLANWSLTRNGEAISRGVKSVSCVFEVDPVTNQKSVRKVIVTFDGNSTETGNQQLEEGTYVLTISGAVEDIFGNSLDGDVNGLPGGSFSRTFTIDLDGTISGTVWSDLDEDTVRDVDDLGLANWTVYLDIPDATHPTGDGIADYTTTTNPDGTYLFTNVHPGTYYVRQVLQTGWSEELPLDGFHEVVVGNTQAVADVDFVDHDIMVPTVTVNKVIANKKDVEGNKIILSGTVSDPTVGTGLNTDEVWVEIIVAGQPQRYKATVVGENWSVALPTALADGTHLIADGTYNVKVTAEDYSGNVGSDATTDELVVDTVKPTVTVKSIVTNQSLVTLTGLVTDPLPSSGIASVVVAIGTETVAATIFGTTWTATVPVALTDGIYDIKVTATDKAGNIGVDATTNEVTVDSMKPIVTVDTLMTNNSRPTLTGNINDPVFTSGIASVTVNVNGQVLAAEFTFDTTTGQGTWTLDMLAAQASALPDGTYDVKVTVRDMAGNSGVDTTYYELVVDSTKPVVTVNPLKTKSGRPTLTGSVIDSSQGTGIDEVTVLVNGEAWDVTFAGGLWQATMPIGLADLTDGTYQVVATATDNAGNVSNKDATKDELVVDRTNPVVTVNTQTAPTSKPTLTGTVDDFNGSGILDVTVVLEIPQTPTAAVPDPKPIVLTMKAKVVGKTWSVTVPTALPDGIYDVKVTAKDNVGNEGKDTTTGELTVSTLVLSNASVLEQRPAGTVVGILGSTGTNVGAYTYEIVPDWTTDTPPKLQDSQYFRIVDNQLQTNAVFDVAERQSYTITIRAKDSAGNVALLPKEFKITVVPVAQKASIGDVVWNDLDADTVRDAGEAGVAGAIVQVYCSPGAAFGGGSDYLCGRAVTDSTGHYLVDDLLPGLNYYVTYTVPQGYTTFTTPVGGVAQVTPTLAVGENRDNLDAGVLGSATGITAIGIGGLKDDYGQSITVDSAGNMYVSGTFQGKVDFDPSAKTYFLDSNGSLNAFVAKYDSVGTLLWARNVGGTGSRSTGVVLGTGANPYVYFTGGFSSTAQFGTGLDALTLTSAGGTDAFVAALSTSGDFVWAKGMGGTSDDSANAIAVAPDGSVCTTGFFQGTADFDPDEDAASSLTSASPKSAFISKLGGSDGAFVWAKAVGGINWNQGATIGAGIAIGTDGSVYTTGSFEFAADFNPGASQNLLTSAGDTDIYVSKLDASGNFVWADRIGGVNEDYSAGIALAADGSVYTTGGFFGIVDFNPGSAVANLDSTGAPSSFVSKLDSSGNYVWARAMGGTYWDGIGGTGWDRGAGIAVAADGSVVTTGGFWGTADFDPSSGVFNLISAGSKDVFATKLDSAGNFVAAVRMGSSGDDCGNGVAIAANGDVFTTGYFQGTASFPGATTALQLTSAGGQDVFISKWTPAATPVVVVSTGPKVSGVMVVEEALPRDGIMTAADPLVMTWNAVDPDGVASATLYVDGKAMTDVRGPYATISGVNFAAMIGTLTAGTHTYSITAIDKLGNVSASARVGSFEVATSAASVGQRGPVVSGVMAVEVALPRDGFLTPNDPLVMTWNAVDPDGVASATLFVDGIAMTDVRGPYATVSGVNFAAMIGTLAAGTHTYSIKATDKLGYVTTTACVGSFDVDAAGTVTPVQSGPTVSGVSVVESSEVRDGVLMSNEPLVMSWHADDADGVAGATLLVDGAVTQVYGPYAATYGANFSAILGTMAAGSHTYSIVATDKVGNVTSPASTGTFTVTAASSGGGGGFALMVDASTASQDVATTVTDAELQSIVAEAERRLTEATGIQVADVMSDVTIQITDLPAAMLGEATSSAIYIDRDAAGYGWFIDSTPMDDAEFSDLLDAHTVAARNGTAAAGRADLLTTVMHEMGHVLGYDHSDLDDLMGDTLTLGERRTSVDGKSLAATWDAGVGSKGFDGASLLDEVMASFCEPSKKKWSLI